MPPGCSDKVRVPLFPRSVTRARTATRSVASPSALVITVVSVASPSALVLLSHRPAILAMRLPSCVCRRVASAVLGQLCAHHRLSRVSSAILAVCPPSPDPLSLRAVAGTTSTASTTVAGCCCWYCGLVLWANRPPQPIWSTL
eukprot:SAG31_NODE_3971_length_3705_cov_3.354964_2_plen_143_part_00